MRFGKRRAHDHDDAAPTPSEAMPETANDRVSGPRDVEEVDPTDGYVDLGSLLIRAVPGLELQLQVEEATGVVAAAVLVGDDGAMEVRAFASSRGGDVWTDARSEIAAEANRLGGTSAEQDGPFGLELRCDVPVTAPDGTTVLQPSRVFGFTGSRWFLRGTLLGPAAQEPERGARYEEAFGGIAIRRGSEAMPPGAALPLRTPPEAHRHA